MTDRDARLRLLPVLVVVVALTLACVLVTSAITRSAVGPLRVSSRDGGVDMACVQLADEGVFPGIAPGTSPEIGEFAFPATFVCTWPSGERTTYDIFRFDPVALAMLVVALILVLGVVVRCIVARGRVRDAP